MFLTPHFTLAEMTASQIANRAGLDNNPDSQVIANLVELCKTLESVRSLVGQPILLTSGYRCGSWRNGSATATWTSTS